MRKYLSLAIVIACFNISQHASAQYIGSWDYNTAFNTADFTANDINTRMMEEVIQGDSSNEIRQSGSVSNVTNLTYPVSKQIRRANIAKFVQTMKRSDPATGAQAETLFASGAIIDQLDEMMRPWGLRANNVADAYTVWWVAAWHAVHRRELNPNPTIMAAVKRQAEGALFSTPQMASATNATKQEIAEALLIHAALIDGHIDDAAGNSTKQAALAKAVNQGAKHMGLDLTKMSLTQDGFVPRSGGRSDVGDAAGDDGQLAANDDGAQTEGANMGDYALYAVAGTGLLAGMFALGKGFSKKG